MLVAGVDSSTQATKVLIVDADDGRVVARGRSSHRVFGTEGTRESDPEQWWEALQRALDETGRKGEVSAIAVAGQQHALVVLDARGGLLRPAALWNDTTSAKDANELIAAFGGRERWATEIGSVPTSAFTVAKWSRLRREEPAIHRKVAAVRLPHEFLIERLCGRAVGDRGDASGTGWWSPIAEDYVAEVLELDRVALDRALLPEVLTASEIAGTVEQGKGAELGLAGDTAVAAGTGDNMSAAVGLGLTPGTPVLSLGTSGTVFAIAEHPARDVTGTVAGFADAGRRFLPLACTLNATLAIDRVAQWLGIDRDDVEPAGEVVMLPFLDGERTPNYPRAAGTITGLRHDTRPQQILQAAYEGVIVSLLDALGSLEELAGGVNPSAPLTLVGGGARGATWRATVAQLSGRPVVVPAEAEFVALGAAALAAASISGEDAARLAGAWANGRPSTEIEGTVRDKSHLRRLSAVRDRLTELNEFG